MAMPRRGWKRPPRADFSCARLLLKLKRDWRKGVADAAGSHSDKKALKAGG